MSTTVEQAVRRMDQLTGTVIPDGPNEVTVAVLGQEVSGEQVEVFSIDAGAGWEWAGWVQHRDECLARASAGLQEPLRAAEAGTPCRLPLGHNPWPAVGAGR